MKCILWLCLVIFSVEPLLAVDFDTEIIPVLTKSGCNAGACHGAAAGRGGFHLSLLGSNPAADYDAIVHELEGRRINQAHPERSLLLAKPTGELDHGGDVALEDEGAGKRRLIEWIRAGAPRSQIRKLVSFEISPERYLGKEIPARVSLKAMARFDDGAPEEVTEWTVFAPTDPAAVEIDRMGRAKVACRGQHVVIARFLNRVVPIQFNMPFTERAIDMTALPRANFIDVEILRGLSEMRIPLSPPASDSEWLRRVTLDLTGRLPGLATIKAFMEDKSAERRRHYVEAMLASDEFSEYWTLRFSKLLRMRPQPNEREGFEAYAAWLRQEIGSGTGFDQIAYQLLTATGDSHEVGPANFGRMVNDAREHAELVGNFFLGMRLGCANCHNHPLDKWTQDDYHGFAAVFAKLERGRIVRWSSRGAVTNLRTNEPATPRIPGEYDVTGEGDYREEVAGWLTAGENRYFARATVNRLWQAMFGRGLVEPIDDLRETNPPTHPDLLNQLAEDFVTHGYDIRRTLELISLSHTYARSGKSVAGNKSDDRFYSHAYSRPLPSEVLVDAIADVTGVINRFDGQPKGMRAVSLIDPSAPAPSLDILGRCTKTKNCDEGLASSGSLSSQLHLLNGEFLNQKLTVENGQLHRMIVSGQTDEQIVRQFFLRALSRVPSSTELRDWSKKVSDNDTQVRMAKLEDFVWSLLNSRAFLENH